MPAVTFDVPYCEEYVFQEIQFLKSFYFLNFLPFVVDRIKSKALIIPSGYVQLKNE